jgi:aspartate kinase
MLLAYGFLRRVAEVFEHYQTPIDMLASSEISISMTIDNNRHLSDIVDDLKKYGTVSVDKNMAIICIVGDLKCSNIQTRAKILEAVGQLPLRMISYGGSEYNFSFLIKKEDKEQTLRILNEKLF